MPVLKFNFLGIDIDLVYAKWDTDYIDTKTFDLFDNNLAIKEKESLLSLNGWL